MTSWDRVPGPASWVQLRRRRFGKCLAGAMLGFALTFAAGISELQAADLAGSFRGNAFATFANVEAGPIAAQLGRSAYQPCPCRGTNGEVLSNTVNNDLQAGDNGKVLKATATLSTVFTRIFGSGSGRLTALACGSHCHHTQSRALDPPDLWWLVG